MNLMLAVLVLCIAVGLFSPRFERRTYWVLVAVATFMIGLYWFLPNRFMTG